MPSKFQFIDPTGEGVQIVSTPSSRTANIVDNTNILINNNQIAIASSISEFTLASELITTHRKAIKTEMDELASNVYSTLNQLNFSLKMITDTNHFLSKYVNTETSIKDKLVYALTTALTEDVSISLYDNVAFNSLFISSMIYFENFARILMEAISYHLALHSIEESIYTIYEKYCNVMFIKND
jgi:hypothetical protein